MKEIFGAGPEPGAGSVLPAGSVDRLTGSDSVEMPGCNSERYGLRRGPEDRPVGGRDLDHQPVTGRQPVPDAVQRDGDPHRLARYDRFR